MPLNEFDQRLETHKAYSTLNIAKYTLLKQIVPNQSQNLVIKRAGDMIFGNIRNLCIYNAI